MTAKKTQNVPPTKEEKDEALRAFMYGDIPRPLISMDERHPDLEESDNSVISTGINAVISPTTKEEVQKQETPPKNEQEEEAQPKPVSLPDGKQTPAHRVSSKQRRLSLDEYGTVFLPVPKIDHPKPVFISESLRDELDKVARRLGGKRMSASGIVENMVKHHEGGTIVWKLRFECGEVMFSASRKRPRPHSRCEGNPLPTGRRFSQSSH